MRSSRKRSANSGSSCSSSAFSARRNSRFIEGEPLSDHIRQISLWMRFHSPSSASESRAKSVSSCASCFAAASSGELGRALAPGCDGGTAPDASGASGAGAEGCAATGAASARAASRAIAGRGFESIIA